MVNFNPPRRFSAIFLVVAVCFIVAILPQVTAFDWTTNISAYYKLDDNLATTVVNDLTNTNEGTLEGGDNTEDISVAGKISTALELDGANDYINTTYNRTTTGDFTYSFWINLKNWTTNTYIFGHGNGVERLYVSLDDDGGGHPIASFYLDTGAAGGYYVDGTSEIKTGEWTHIVAVWDDSGSEMKLYVNGSLEASNDTIVGSVGTILQPLFIGSINNGGTPLNHFNGTVDEVGIWTRALNTSEITELWNSGSGTTYREIGEDAIMTLESPLNESILSETSINFTASGNNISTSNWEWKNLTYFIWNETGIFNSTFVDIVDGVTFNNTLLINDFSTGDYEWNVQGCYGNATFNNCTNASSNFTFEWRPFEILSQNYTSFVYETDSKRFDLSIDTLPEILSVSSKLNYNGTLYDATTSCVAGICSIYSIIDIPLVPTGESENRTVYWNVTVYDGTNSYSFDTDDESFIQNITRIHLEKCAGAYTTQTINFTAYYETNLTRINPFYITGTFDTWLGSGSVNRTTSFNEISTADLKLCITPTNRTHYSDAHIEYKFDNENITFIPRNYFFQNKTLTNITEEINLYLLEAEDSTSFIIKVQDQKLSPVTEALVYIQKYYPSDGEYRTVQIAKTDSNGETIGFYETELTDYKHIIIKNGVTLLETASQKVVGKSVPYTLTFTIGTVVGSPWTSFGENLNVNTTLTFDKDTNIVTFNYIENTTDYVTSGRLLVYRSSLTNSTNLIICNVSSTESSATLSCNMGSYNGTFIAIAYINEGSEKIIEFTITDARDVFGNDGLFLGMMIILTAGFAMMWNPTAGIISINAAVIFVNIIGLMSVSPIFIFGMISVSIITIILLKT